MSESGLPRAFPVSPPPSPWHAFERISALPFAIFLDGAAQDPAGGRWSYLAASPFEIIEARGGRVVISVPWSEDLGERRRRTVFEGEADPLQILAERLELRRSPEREDLPPFQGGAAGALGYGLGRSIERIPDFRRDEFAAPDLVLGLYDWAMAFDHASGSCIIVSQGYPAETPGERRARAERRAKDVLAVLAEDRTERAPEPVLVAPDLRMERLEPCWPVPALHGLLSNFSRSDYMAAVSKIVEHIRAGDVFQVNLSQRLIYPWRKTGLELYRRLRRVNPAPWAGYFAMDGFTLASASPEHFLTLERGQIATRPIKGTRPRGTTVEEDARRREELLGSPKDRAENVMIVDLLRNDLSRVARLNSVHVPRLFEAETHPTVHHLVSEVRAEIRDGLGAVDLLRAAFPGGSVTGAPKIRAMQIIADLEPSARGFYCGSLGWIAFHGGMRLNILIRTLTLGRGWVQLPAGGGVVAESEPEVEYEETLHKAAGMLRALDA